MVVLDGTLALEEADVAPPAGVDAKFRQAQQVQPVVPGQVPGDFLGDEFAVAQAPGGTEKRKNSFQAMILSAPQ